MNRDCTEPSNQIEQHSNNGIISIADSRTGEIHQHNEDTIIYCPQQLLFGVFDGVGGEINGADSARTAGSLIQKTLSALPDNIAAADTETAIFRAIVEANYAVTFQAMADGIETGTTVLVTKLLLDQEHTTAVIGSAGDSRAYLFRDKHLEQITQDDGLLTDVVHGITDPETRKLYQFHLNNITKAADYSGKPKDLKFYFDHRNYIHQAIGKIPINPHLYTIELLPGDKLLLLTDGITDNLTDQEIENPLLDSPTAKTALSVLFTQSVSRSREPFGLRPKFDDMSAIIIDLPLPGQPTTSSPTSIHFPEPPPDLQDDTKPTHSIN
jgi:protein phosphatase